MKNSFSTITLLVALGLAAVSGAFSVFGMMAIFSGMPMVGIVAGVAIELGKLVGVSWLYRYWKDGVWFRHILATFTLISMMVTSIGVFGMLSKAHMDQTSPALNSAAKIEVIDEKITREQNKASDAEIALKQLDSQIDVLIQHSKISMKGGAVELRKQQESERKHLENIIDQSREKIDHLQEEKFEVSQTLRDIQVDVGPLAHLAGLLFEETENNLEKAVSLLIIMIMLSLDPMAIMLLMGYNHIKMKEDDVVQTPAKPLVLESPPAIDEEVAEEIPEVAEGKDGVSINNEPTVDILDDIPDELEKHIGVEQAKTLAKKNKKQGSWFF